MTEFVPPSAYLSYTSVSERAIAYDDEPLVHRILILVEAAGLTGAIANLLLRSLLSEGKIRHLTVESTPLGIRPRLVEREGPTGAILTTTSIRLDPELETRMLDISADDSVAQTRAILDQVGIERAPVDLTVWHALAEWIALGDNRVIIPFANRIARLIPPTAVRLRRAVHHLMRMIKSSAALHQATRERDRQGRIVATLEDYATARELLNNLISREVDSSVSETMRATIDATKMLTFTLRIGAAKPETKADKEVHIAVLAAQPAHATLEQIAAELKLNLTDAARAVEAGVKAGVIEWGRGLGTATAAVVGSLIGVDKSVALRRVRAAIEKGFLVNDEDKPARPARLRIGEPLPDRNAGLLPTVEQVSARTMRKPASNTALEFHPAPILLNGDGRIGAAERSADVSEVQSEAD